MTATAPESIEIMDVPITVFESYDHATGVIVETVRRRRRALCVAVNSIKAHKARKDEQLRQTIKSADFCLCDGAGVAGAVRLLHGRRIRRITGIQLFFDLVNCAEARQLKIFLLGAKPSVNRGAYERLREEHPRLQIVGRHHGYFRNSEAVIQQINDVRPDMLFVAMGSPRQERWLAQYRDQIDVPFRMGVGGSFDVLSGAVRRAPRAFRTTGTEWLYRLIAQPRRLREQVVLPLFVVQVFCHYLMTSWKRAARAGAKPVLKARTSKQEDLALGGVRRNPRVRIIKGTQETNLAFSTEPWGQTGQQSSLAKPQATKHITASSMP